MKVIRRLAGTVSLFLSVSFALAGCGSSGSTPVGPSIPNGTTEDLAALISQAVAKGAIVPTNIDTAAVSLLYTLRVDGRSGASALFTELGVTATLLDAGDVSVSPVASSAFALTKHQLTITGFVQTVYTTFITRPLGIALPFDGSAYHRFAVTGSSRVAAFTDSVKSVPPPNVTSPNPGAVVDTLKDLSVAWTPVGDGDTTVYVICGLRSLVDTTLAATGAIARDADGNALIPRARLARLPVGSATLSVARYRLAARVFGGRRTALLCEAATTRIITLN